MKLTFILLFLSFPFFFISCKTQSLKAPQQWQTIQARNIEDSLQRPPIYRVQLPSNWLRKDFNEYESVFDTKLPIAEFFIVEQDNIRITIHTFPISNTSPSIPSLAQVQRWKNQFESLDLVSTRTTKESRGGFHGLFFEGEGIIEGNPISILAWSMQLAPFYITHLDKEKNESDSYKKADYTIKAVGPTELIQKHRDAIIQFAHSFELIEEIVSSV